MVGTARVTVRFLGFRRRRRWRDQAGARSPWPWGGGEEGGRRGRGRVSAELRSDGGRWTAAAGSCARPTSRWSCINFPLVIYIYSSKKFQIATASLYRGYNGYLLIQLEKLFYNS